jgi:hypothetical protein
VIEAFVSGIHWRLTKPSTKCDAVRYEYGTPTDFFLYLLTQLSRFRPFDVPTFGPATHLSKNNPMVELSEDRIAQLEKLVSSLRHDVRGIVTPVALAADHLHKSSDPAIQRSAAGIDEMIERLVLRLNSTYGLVPPTSGIAAAPLSRLASRKADKADAPILISQLRVKILA